MAIEMVRKNVTLREEIGEKTTVRLRKDFRLMGEIAIVRVRKEVRLLGKSGEMAIFTVSKVVRLMAKSGEITILRVIIGHVTREMCGNG
jgi:hypothetical protein